MEEARFHTYVEEMVNWLMEQLPVMATFMGLHAYDHLLSDFSKESSAAFDAKLKEHLTELQKVETKGWSKESAIDHILIMQALKDIQLEREVGAFNQRNPGIYLEEIMEGIFALVIKDFAPLKQRLQSVLGRVEEAQRVLEQARANLQPEQVPRIWAEMALEQARMGPPMFQMLLPAMAVDFPDLQEKLAEAGQKAAEACNGFAAYIEEEIMPAAAGEFAVGEEHFNTLLKEKHLVDYDAAELLETGWQLFNETRDQMEALGRQVDPGLSIAEILEKDKEDHPQAEELMAEYHRFMEAAKQFTVERGIASIPPGETLQIIETPTYLRPIIPYAAYIPPGIFEENLEGVFLVTPPDADASPEEQEEKLKGQPYSKIPLTALHEAYPGHHLQLAWSAYQGSVARKTGMMLSTFFIEGWAFYCEELMEELGFINSPIEKLGRLADQLWRAARIIIDVSLHCRGMSVEEAVSFLVERCALQPGDALAEVRRYTSSPTQPQSYLMGKLEIMKIIEEYKEKYPADSLQQMHDAILACGSLPPKLMRWQLFQ